MKDWRSIARAYHIEIPAQDFVRVGPPLDALDEAFRPLVNQLDPDMEPAVEFRAEEDA
jgi:hypothetical protein